MVINPENANLSYCSQVLMRRFEEGGRCYRWTFLFRINNHTKTSHYFI